MTQQAFIYERVANRIADMIAEGVFQAGEKVPSLRLVTRQFDVSMTSALQAYRLLERRDLIEAAPKSGFFVKHQASHALTECVTARREVVATKVTRNQFISEFLERICPVDRRLFGCASIDVSLQPQSALGRIMSDVIRHQGSLALDYQFPPGNSALRRQLAKRALHWGCSFGSQDITVTSGGLDALNLCLRVVGRPGGSIAIESPTYFGVLQAIENQGMQAVEIPTDPVSGVNLDALEQVLVAGEVDACLFIPNFNNPLGSLMPDAHKRRLADMLHQYSTPLIEDDVYGDLHFGLERPRPVKAYDRDGWVLLCSSFSKTLSPGLRVGWVVSERHHREITRLQHMTTLGGSSIGQVTVAQFLEEGRYDRHLRQLRKTLMASVNIMSQKIAEQFPPGTKMTNPQGGFVLWIELPPGAHSLQLYRQAMARGISLVPGLCFATDEAYARYLRITCSYPWNETVAQSLSVLAGLACEMVREPMGA